MKRQPTYQIQSYTGNQDAHRNDWYGCRIEAEVMAMQSEIKKNLQVTNSGVDEAENQIKDLEHKEDKNIQSEQQEERTTFKEQVFQKKTKRKK